MGEQHIAVQIRNLTKVIGRRTIVDNVSFDIPKGEVFGLLGPNGAGKTTTIRMMVGLISKNNGEVYINGIDVAKNFTEAMNHVGAIVENPELYRYLSGYRNLKLFANMSKGVTEERIREVVKLVGLEQRINDKVKTYSLGMRQRLGLAQALLRKPDVLILDEPTNGLDPAGIRELRDHLRMLAKQEGLTVIVSSHLLSEMELMCDRVAIIQNGKLISVKTIQDLVSGEGTQQVTELEVGQVDTALEVLQREYSELPTPVVNGDKITVALSRDDTPKVVQSLVTAGVQIYGVHLVNHSLEDKFLEMTGGGKSAI